MTDYFVGIVDPATLHAGKPDPEIFARAAEVMNLPADQVAGLEDSAAGIQSINGAGELSIGIGDQLSAANVKFTDTAQVSLANLRAALGE